MKILKIIWWLAFSFLLTVVTQLGGLLFLLSLYFTRNVKKNKQLKQAGVFLGSYVLCLILIVPIVAPIFGRERVIPAENLKPANHFYPILFRNYVSSELNEVLKGTSDKIAAQYPGATIQYLDACFPFIDRFPLLPHLSHNDGNKIDLSFLYSKNSELVTELPSRSGYGVYVEPIQGESNQTEFCKSNGYWQYDYSKHMTLGKRDNSLEFNIEVNRFLLKSILESKAIKKVFLEPHLVERLGIEDKRIRFHGCHAVRHDDHYHIQV